MEGVELCRRSGFEKGEAHALFQLGGQALADGDLAAAGEHLRRSKRMCERIGYRIGLGMVATYQGDLHRLSGELPEAESAYQAAFRVFERASRERADLIRGRLALVWMMRGRWVEAEGELRGAIDRMREENRDAWVGVMQLYLLPCLTDPEQWDQMLDEGTRAYEASGLHEPNVAWVLSLAAERAMAHGWYERAARLTERENPPR